MEQVGRALPRRVRLVGEEGGEAFVVAVVGETVETLEDGKNGFAKAADKLAGSDRPDLAEKFRFYSQQRERFCAELDTMAAADPLLEPWTVVTSHALKTSMTAFALANAFAGRRGTLLRPRPKYLNLFRL